MNGWWARAQSPANLDLVLRNDGDFKRHLNGWLVSPLFIACMVKSARVKGIVA